VCTRPPVLAPHHVSQVADERDVALAGVLDDPPGHACDEAGVVAVTHQRLRVGDDHDREPLEQPAWHVDYEAAEGVLYPGQGSTYEVLACLRRRGVDGGESSRL